MRTGILFLLFVLQAQGYWHTAKICLKISHAEQAVVRTCQKVGRGIKHVFVRGK